MSDIEKIRQEIERLKIDYLNRSYTFVPTTMQQLLEFIDSLSEEPLSEDLEEAKEAYCNEHNDDCIDAIGDYCPHIRKAFKAGAEWQKEQMMEEAVEGEVCILPSNVAYVKEKNNESLKQHLLDNFKAGDKVRIIIVKEDKR